MMIGELPTNVTDIQSHVSKIEKSSNRYIYRYQKAACYEVLCKLWETNQQLTLNYFRASLYTKQHCLLAAFLYSIYGIEVYTTIKSIFPQKTGEKIACWDDFLFLQLDTLSIIHYGISHHPEYYTGFNFNREQFIEDLAIVCDDDLYIELLCSIVRNSKFCSFDSPYQTADYVIDYEYLYQRSKSMPQTPTSMKRYISLVECLAEFSYFDALRAWGDFYYVFEEVYSNSPLQCKSFTGAMYNIFFSIAQHNSKEQDVAADLIADSSRKVHEIIYNYGWKYLHHAFEINTLSDYGVHLIYENLPDGDKVQADAATQKFLATRNIRIKQPQKDPVVTTPDFLIDLFMSDPSAALASWKATLQQMRKNRFSKKAHREWIDNILERVMLNEKFTGVFKSKKLPMIPIIEYPFSPVFLLILGDSWLTEYIFTHCQKVSAPASMAAVLLLLNDTEGFVRIIKLIKDNVLLNAGFDSFLKTLRFYALEWAENLIIKAKETYDSHFVEIRKGGFGDEQSTTRIDFDINCCFRGMKSHYIDPNAIPSFIVQVWSIIEYCDEMLRRYQ